MAEVSGSQEAGARVRTALILGTHSFVDGGLKVGLQQIAQGLVERGWKVDYVATASSPFDLWGRARHGRLHRVWMGNQATDGYLVEPGLTEYAFRALYPAHKLFLRYSWQLKLTSAMLPKWIRAKTYDVCIHETSPNVIYLDSVQARRKIFRFSDLPAGFSHDLCQVVIETFESNIALGKYDEIWAVSGMLERFAHGLTNDASVVLLPNGVEDNLFLASAALKTARQPRSAVFIGGLNQPWVDFELLAAVARLLPEWRLDCIGPGRAGVSAMPPNLCFKAPIARDQVYTVLSTYEVGLIPFRKHNGLVDCVERPLKFYEYIAAGLGVASTAVGSLRVGMGDLAAYGNTPEEFAAAILQARDAAAMRSAEFGRKFVAQNGWNAIIDQAVTRLDALLGG